ncbi:hypothetical protein [Erythrobacter neustonensis]|uniref:Uncharacterized protein n=1 Tax=Erythrobacter neustonensis TaxID=1112 RepID=A0A192D1A1_9SPHN|nr:hypothetical protein [Erythrobacter neustonensis]ANK11732.1 hypothetical protein A9D12_00815 [Erythrobacter neustonensis]
MASQPEPSSYDIPAKPRSARPLIFAALLAFAAGGGLVGWVMWHNLGPQSAAPARTAGVQSGSGPALTASATPIVAAAMKAEQAAERVAEQQGGIDQRLAAAEQRLTRLDLQAQAAAGNAARAESLLIAFATRRSLERGAELGYLADQLRLRFGDQWPNAVRTIIDFSRNPVRLDSLTARLEGLSPQLNESAEGPSWGAFKREFKQLFVFRRQTTPSPQPQKRMERARWALEQGRLSAAIEEVRGMPGAAKAQSWIADAERYRKAMEALEVIETAAVLDQRGLRDGAGNPVQQSSPLVRP